MSSLLFRINITGKGFKFIDKKLTNLPTKMPQNNPPKCDKFTDKNVTK